MIQLVTLLLSFLAIESYGSTVILSCNLNSRVTAISPLNETLDYTRGSGRGLDIAMYSGSDIFARLGDLTFSSSLGDTQSVALTKDGTSVFVMKKSQSSVTFRITIASATAMSGKYGLAPLTQRSAKIDYRVDDSAHYVNAAYLLCN